MESNIKKYDIRMIALDLDGTTLTSDRKISRRTREAFERCREKRVHVVVSTGRVFTALPEDVKAIRGIEYAITSNGAHINEIASGKSIYDDYLSAAAVDEVAKLYRELDAEIEVFFDGQAFIAEDYYNDIREHGLEYRSAEYVLWSRRPVSDVAALMLSNRDRIENVNFCFSSIEALEQNRAAVTAIPEATITSSFQTNLEVGGPNTSKKKALIELMKRLGIEREQLMCCGDAPNDIQMIEYAGLGVAVGNAWGGTKDHADYITGTNDEDGVAQAIEKFVLR
ncbi:MAG: HAD family phosphatase [Mogibacterium sp.]|nr:HAD family phosphatase [Mogibacterium sp.]